MNVLYNAASYRITVENGTFFKIKMRTTAISSDPERRINPRIIVFFLQIQSVGQKFGINKNCGKNQIENQSLSILTRKKKFLPLKQIDLFTKKYTSNPWINQSWNIELFGEKHNMGLINLLSKNCYK